MEYAVIVARQAAIMLMLLAVGFGLYKGKLLGDEATKQLSNIALTVINPIVIFNAYQTEFDPAKLRGLLTALGLSLASQVLLIIAAMIVIRPSRKSYETERFAISYTNCAFMGIPLVEAVFGTDGVFYLTAFVTIFNIFLWTHGVVVMQGKTESSAKARLAELVKILTSPAIISIALGLVFFFTGLRLPSLVQTPLNYLGAMNTPIAMIVSGATIAKSGLLDCFRTRSVYLLQTAKLLLVPALLAGLFVPLQLFGVSSVVINTVLIAAAAPTASATIMFAYKHNRDEKCASNHFALSTLASIITIPLMLMLSGMLTRLFIP
ncbi:MAG: AEC family transporter [Oscillospiraceae bacterium]|nr:AEC family transporter [Oscillospiraceae bacterium]